MESIWASWKGVSEVESLSLRAGKPHAFVASVTPDSGRSGKSAKWDSEIDCGGRGPFRGRPLDQARGSIFYKNVQIERRSGMLRNMATRGLGIGRTRQVQASCNLEAPLTHSRLFTGPP